MTTLSIATAVCGAVEVTQQFLNETMGNCSEPRQLCVAFNGCTDEEVHQILLADRDRDGGIAVTVNPEPQGLQALNDAVSLAKGDVVAILHNDLLIRQPGWDVTLLEFFDAHPDAGVVGFAGARKLGRDDIYRTPYQLAQLAREDVWTSLEDWQAHGRQATEPVEVAVLDGLAICLRMDLWRRLGGFDRDFGPWHLYDIHLSLRALEEGFANYVLPIRSRHLGGQTANASRYQRRFGPDSEVHRIAHERFYARYKGRLPVRV